MNLRAPLTWADVRISSTVGLRLIMRILPSRPQPRRGPTRRGHAFVDVERRADPFDDIPNSTTVICHSRAHANDTQCQVVLGFTDISS
jgi:hypothetical protein